MYNRQYEVRGKKKYFNSGSIAFFTSFTVLLRPHFLREYPDLSGYNIVPKRYDSHKSSLCISMDTCSYCFHPIIVNEIQPMSSSPERNLQFIRTVDWLGYPVTVFQVCGHLKRVDIHVGCLPQSHEFPQRHSKGPLRRRAATP